MLIKGAELCYSLGKVRPAGVKRISKELVDRFPERFTEDFDSNKEVVEALTNVSSRKLRNRIAGYVTHLVGITRSSREG